METVSVTDGDRDGDGYRLIFHYRASLYLDVHYTLAVYCLIADCFVHTVELSVTVEKITLNMKCCCYVSK